MPDRVPGFQADLFLEGGVDFQQVAVGQAGDDQDVRALLEDRGEFLFRQAQRFFGALGFADVDHQAADDGFTVVFDQADQIADPERATIGADHPIVERVVATFGDLLVAEGLGTGQVGRVGDAAPEAWDQPMGQRITEQGFSVGRDIGVGEVHARFPGDGRQTLHQAAVMVFAAAQFLLEGHALGYFRTQPAVDAHDHGQYGDQQQDARQAVEQQVGPDGATDQDVAYPAILDRLFLGDGHLGHDLVDNAHEDFLLPGHGHRQL